MSARATSVLVALTVALGLLRPATAQAPTNSQAAAAGSSSQTQPASKPGPPLFGQPRPNVGPDPTPRIKRPYECPLGYMSPRDTTQMAHLVVCVVKPADLVTLNNVSGPNPPAPGTLSSMPPILERTTVNQCAGRPTGSYACGRGGTECCRPNQDNMCFAGAFACYPHGTGTGAKTACCMSK